MVKQVVEKLDKIFPKFLTKTSATELPDHEMRVVRPLHLDFVFVRSPPVEVIILLSACMCFITLCCMDRFQQNTRHAHL